MPYDAFISYSHKADAALSEQLEAALQRFGKPLFKLRGTSVFRDQSNLSLTPHLWGSIREALSGSSSFILLASPEAAASRWVREEASFWRDSGRIERLFVVLTEGELRWDRDANDFDWARTSALPDTLKGAFAGEPLWLDLRWTRSMQGDVAKDPRFQESAARIVAAIRGKPLEDIYGDELRRHRRLVRLRDATIVLLAVLAAVAVGFGLTARAQSAIARRNAVVARAHADTARANAAEAERAQRTAEAAAAAERQARQGTRLQLDFVNSILMAQLALADLRWEGAGEVKAMTVYFAYDGLEVPSEAVQHLEKLASLLRQIPTLRVRVAGHFAEFSPEGAATDEYALALSNRRASSLKAYLVSRGIPADRILTTAFGNELPLISASNPEERINQAVRLLNSRAEIYLYAE